MITDIVTKLEETSRHAAKQRSSLVSRTRSANVAWLRETRSAGHDVVVFVRGEAKSWRKFLVLRVSKLESGVRAALTPSGLEQKVLLGVDGTLRALDARVRKRLAVLESPASRTRARALNGAPRTGRKTSARPKPAKLPAPAAAIAGH
jgi:hypothetical protein